MNNKQWVVLAMSFVVATAVSAASRTRTSLADSSAEPQKSDKGPTTFELGLGLGFGSRSFVFNQPANQPEFPKTTSFSSNGVSFVQLRGQVHPMSQVPGLGVNAQINLYRQNSFEAGTMGDAKLSSKSSQLNLRYRHRFNGLELAIEAGVARNKSKFAGDDLPLLSELPSVDYLSVRTAIIASHNITKSIRVSVGANLLGPLEVGAHADRLMKVKSSVDGSPVFRNITVRGAWGVLLGMSYQITSHHSLAIHYRRSRFDHSYRLYSGSEFVASDDFEELGLNIVFAK